MYRTLCRCGSTLLSQMMNRVPGTRSISEPMATVNVYQLWHAGKIRWKLILLIFFYKTFDLTHRFCYYKKVYFYFFPPLAFA